MIERNGWHMLVVPAIAPDDAVYRTGPRECDRYMRREGEVLVPGRDSAEELDRTRQALGSFNFAAQYQQAPVPASGNLIKREWLCFYDYGREPKRFDRKVVSWDTASTVGPRSSFSAGTVWGLRGLNFYLLDVVHGRFESSQLRRLVVDTHRAERADFTIIEKTDHGRLLAESLVADNELKPRYALPRKGKAHRLAIEAPRFENGLVWLPREAPWLARYVAELVGFPNVPHKDLVDSTAQALAFLARYRRPPQPDPSGLFGPTGRRTRASLTRRAPEPARAESEPEDDEIEEIVGPSEPVVRKVEADWEPEHDKPPVRHR